MAWSSFTIEVAPPFRLDLTVWALRRRSVNQVDQWDSTTWRRTVFVGESPVELAVTQGGSVDVPCLHVYVSGAPSRTSHELVRKVVDRALGLEVDLAPFYEIATRDSRLNDLSSRFRGMRPPRFPTIFEALVNGIACQQLSLEAGLALLNRRVATHGRSPSSLAGAGKAFPRPHDLARATVPSLRTLGFSKSKSAAIIEIARAAMYRDIDFDALASLDDASLFAKLDALRGVGRWTAEYVLLRGYGRLDVFPGDDIGARNGLRRWLGLKRPLDYERTKKVLQRWQPYGGLVYLHLLLKYLDERGMIASDADRDREGCSPL